MKFVSEFRHTPTSLYPCHMICKCDKNNWCNKEFFLFYNLNLIIKYSITWPWQSSGVQWQTRFFPFNWAKFLQSPDSMEYTRKRLTASDLPYFATEKGFPHMEGRPMYAEWSVMGKLEMFLTLLKSEDKREIFNFISIFEKLDHENKWIVNPCSLFRKLVSGPYRNRLGGGHRIGFQVAGEAMVFFDRQQICF